MKSIPALFFGAGVVAALVGMVWGVQMSASHDYTLSPAHGHLNLIGFVMMSVFGTYYALTPDAAVAQLARVHLALMVASIVMLVPGIALAISGRTEILAQIGSLLTILSVGVFGYTILRYGIGTTASQSS